MNAKGHRFLITARQKDITIELLKSHGVLYYDRGKGSHTFLGRYCYVAVFLLRYLWKILSFNPDLCFSIGSPYSIIIAHILKKPGIVFEDTESAINVLKIYLKYADLILTPSCFRDQLGSKQIYISSYKELAYLNKNQYTPNPSVFQLLNINPNQKYILFRFVSHRVNHDKKNDGLTFEMKKLLISSLSKYTKIFISTDRDLTPIFPEFELNTPVEKIHDVIAYSKLVIGESATMTAEAAVLGVPSIFFDNYGRGYTEELEKKYRLIHSYKISPLSLNEAINKAIEILAATNDVTLFNSLQKLQEDKINISAFIVWFIENYPSSLKTMQENPDYQFRFR
jgi:uncharacterized protein